MDRTEVNIGFDIGISSVGWSVVATKSGRILESGVSLFSGASAAKNEERRNFRQSRRLLRRRKNRISDLKKYLKEQSFTYNGELLNENPYEIRVKGLTEKLSKEEIALALLHIVKRRGVSYDLGDIEEEGTTGSYKEGVKKNQKLLKEKTPAEIQFQRLKKFHKVRGQIAIDENDVLLNVFPNHAYVDEAQQILAVQQEFYPEIDEAFINQVTGFISRKRDYFIGPGSKKSRTDYGIYRTDGTTLQNLFSILIGKDKIFPDEFRAAGNSYTAQIYNLLNDLNNLAIDDTETGKLTKQQKEKIITELKTTEKNVNMMKLIAKTAGVTVEQISRYRINRDGKPEIHKWLSITKLEKCFLN
nr:type II CRISPR RNA-guided endonuclease Cas9 [uncultured Enterococcus sp.]